MDHEQKIKEARERYGKPFLLEEKSPRTKPKSPWLLQLEAKQKKEVPCKLLTPFRRLLKS